MSARKMHARRTASGGAPQSEAGFYDALRGLALLTGWDEPYHTHDSRRSPEGFPDVVLARPGMIVALELKVGRRQATGAQLRWIERFRSAGVPAAVVWPADWPALEALLVRRQIPDSWR